MQTILINIGYDKPIFVRSLATLPDALHRRILEKRRKVGMAKKSPKLVGEIEERMKVEFVYNSNSIEGVTLSRGETELALRGVAVRGRSLADVLAAQNHEGAMRLVRELAFGSKELSERDILSVHKAIMSGIISSAGEYRRGDVAIRGASFSPPPAHEVQDQVSELLQFVKENPDELRPVELAAHAHYYMAWIHPFDDGNGRMARLLTNLLLLRHGYPFAVIKKVERKKYLDTLDAVTARGDFEPFLVFIARCVEQTLDIYINAMQKTPAEKLRPLNDLAKKTPYSAEYLSLQARKGILDAVKVGRVWMSTEKTIANYIKEHGRKSTK